MTESGSLAELSSWIGKEGPIAFEPGQQFFYADAHNSVAAIIEQISGLDYETYLQQKIFGPLGMVDATFLTSTAQRARYNKAPMDTKNLAPKWLLPLLPKFLHMIHDLNDKPHMARGDIGLKGSMDDWTRLNRCLLNGGELDGVRVLSSNTVEWMSSNHVVPEVVRAGPEFVVGLSPKQRSVLGIPAVGDRYWNAETVGLLAERYPGIDTAPYAATGARL